MNYLLFTLLIKGKIILLLFFITKSDIIYHMFFCCKVILFFLYTYVHLVHHAYCLMDMQRLLPLQANRPLLANYTIYENIKLGLVLRWCFLSNMILYKSD